MARTSRLIRIPALAVLLALPASAQQFGSISGTVRSSDGTVLVGVAIEARSDGLPQARRTATSAAGTFRFPVLPPGAYVLRFSLEGLAVETRTAMVLLDQAITVDVTMGHEPMIEELTVSAESLVGPALAAIGSALSGDVIAELPLGQEYRHIIALLPSVQYTEDRVRGPSAGSHGQDNVYRFDGVDVTMPLFGVLSAEPSSHDVEQIAFVKGGAAAIDFNRAGGLTIDSLSRSGTSDLTGRISYRIQGDSMSAEERTNGGEYDQDRAWWTASVGGPVLAERLFFYGSHYRPTIRRSNSSTLYGPVPPFRSTRDELFGKLTFTPTGSILLHGSYRDSARENDAAGVAGAATAGSASTGSDATLRIATVEASWVRSDRSFAALKASEFETWGRSRPDDLLDFRIALDGSVRLDVERLDRQGLLIVPQPIGGAAAYNDFIAPLVEKYGFLRDGVRVGGGRNGVAALLNETRAGRRIAQAGWDFSLGGRVAHDVHVGYQWSLERNEVASFSNGWGVITVPGGRTQFNGRPVFFQARFQQMSLGEDVIPTIRSGFESQTIEINDSMRWGRWAANVGLLASRDTLLGQGLKRDGSTVSGFVAAPGHEYVMHRIAFDQTIQPRLGVTFAYDAADTVFAAWSRYHPAVTSLPAAASWDRNLARAINAYFDRDGTLIGAQPLVGSSGKLFDDDLDPRVIDELVLGTARELSRRWSGRAYTRYRRATNFWEDTNNEARLAFGAPPGVPREPYIPDLDQRVAQIGSGSSYVIAELDGAFTKYWEVSLESEWRSARGFLRGSYTWSHYYGNFDQDNTAGWNDDAIYIGSSFIADGPGRQLWDHRYGDLRGDRRHAMKIYGTHSLPWNATIGAWAVYQSGQPWEAWSYEPYLNLGSELSDTGRFAEPAGSRRTDDHHQIDLNYTQSFPVAGTTLQLAADVFNVTNNQTGYNVQNQLHLANFGRARSFFDPRRIQLALRILF